MSIKNTFTILVIVTLLTLAAGCTGPGQAPAGQQPATTPAISMTVPFGPVPVESMNGVNIAYELEFSGMENLSFRPEKVEVIDAATGTVLYTPNASVLARTSYPAAVPPPAAAEMQNGTAKLPRPRISV